LRFGLARFAIVLMGAAVWPPIARIGIATTVFPLAPFEVFSIRGAAFGALS